jgi:two-component system sensor histidine kinase KdpD
MTHVTERAIPVGRLPVLRWRQMLGAPFSAGAAQSLLLALALVAGTTICMSGLTRGVQLSHVSVAYLLPVLVAAIKLGLVPALAAAIAGLGASAFFFYAPIYDFRVSDPQQLVDLVLFVVVAVVTSQLASSARTHAALAQEREDQMRALYRFSRRLAVATEPGQISAAIQDHLSSISRRHVMHFVAGGPKARPSGGQMGAAVPDAIQNAVDALARAGREGASLTVQDPATGNSWLIRPVSRDNAAFGLLAVDLGPETGHAVSTMEQSLDEVLADAAATLERLDVAHAINEARLRAEAETLRDALMGSVTHGLRTPLASIIGSASILAESPAVAQDARSADLAGIIRDEAERLNRDIQRLVDASRISSAGVRPHLAWTDVEDIVNSALSSQRRRLGGHRVVLRLPEELPLVHVDAVLIEQALGQIIDNAAKYSPAGSTIQIDCSQREAMIAIAVGDEGVGFTPEEGEHLFERFYRGPRSASTATGTGLGLWIAQAFTQASGATLEAASAGAGKGAIVTMLLPAPTIAAATAPGDTP